MVLIILEEFPEIRKIEVFDDRDPVEYAIFSALKFLHISQLTELIFTFKLSWSQLVMVLIILKAYQNVEKNEVFQDRRPVENMLFATFTFLHIHLANE